jgi:hypothetical protein
LRKPTGFGTVGSTATAHWQYHSRRSTRTGTGTCWVMVRLTLRRRRRSAAPTHHQLPRRPGAWSGESAAAPQKAQRQQTRIVRARNRPGP